MSSGSRAMRALLVVVALVAIACLVILWKSDTPQTRAARKPPATARPRVANPERGDVNADGKIDKDDVDYLMAFIFTKGPAPIGDGDVNGDGKVDQGDMLFLSSFVTGGGPAPRASATAATPTAVP